MIKLNKGVVALLGLVLAVKSNDGQVLQLFYFCSKMEIFMRTSKSKVFIQGIKKWGLKFRNSSWLTETYDN